jgi:hypothetical protein
MRNVRALSYATMIAGVVVAGCESHNIYRDASEIAKPALAELYPPRPKTETQTIVVQRPILPFFGGDDTSSDPTLQDTVASSLARIGPDAIPAVITALSDPDAQVRVSAAKSLAQMGPKAAEATQALINSLGDSDENVRRTAAKALGQIGPAAREAIPSLIALLKHPTGVPAKTPPKAATPTTPTTAAPKL